jgi:hypothetical protein
MMQIDYWGTFFNYVTEYHPGGLRMERYSRIHKPQKSVTGGRRVPKNSPKKRYVIKVCSLIA